MSCTTMPRLGCRTTPEPRPKTQELAGVGSRMTRVWGLGFIGRDWVESSGLIKHPISQDAKMMSLTGALLRGSQSPKPQQKENPKQRQKPKSPRLSPCQKVSKRTRRRTASMRVMWTEALGVLKVLKGFTFTMFGATHLAGQRRLLPHGDVIDADCALHGDPLAHTLLKGLQMPGLNCHVS